MTLDQDGSKDRNLQVVDRRRDEVGSDEEEDDNLNFSLIPTLPFSSFLSGIFT